MLALTSHRIFSLTIRGLIYKSGRDKLFSTSMTAVFVERLKIFNWFYFVVVYCRALGTFKAEVLYNPATGS